jgi:hypothetical protein
MSPELDLGAVVVALVGAAFAYGVFKGKAEESSKNAKEATARAFLEIKAAAEDAKRGLRIAQETRAYLQAEHDLERSPTQAGADGRGVPNPLHKPR